MLVVLAERPFITDETMANLIQQSCLVDAFMRAPYLYATAVRIIEQIILDKAPLSLLRFLHLLNQCLIKKYQREPLANLQSFYPPSLSQFVYTMATARYDLINCLRGLNNMLREDLYVTSKDKDSDKGQFNKQADMWILNFQFRECLDGALQGLFTGTCPFTPNHTNTFIHSWRRQGADGCVYRLVRAPFQSFIAPSYDKIFAESHIPTL